MYWTLFCFINLDINPVNWHWGARALLGFVVFLTIFNEIVIKEKEKEGKNE